MPQGVSIQEVKNKAKELGWDAINIGGTEGIVILGGKNKRLTKNTKATLPLGAKWVHGRVGEIYQYNGKIFKVKTPVINAALEEPNEEDEPIEEDVLTEEDDLMEKEDIAAEVEEEGEEADPLLEDDTAEQIGVKTPKGYCVVWPDLESNTDLSKAQIAATKTQAMATYVGGNVESIMPLIHFYTKILGLSDEEAADLVKAAEEQEAEMAMEQQMQNPFGGGGQPPFGQQPPMPGMPGQEPSPPFGQEPGQFPPTEEETSLEEEEIEDEGEPTNLFDQTENVFCPTGEGGGVDPSCGGDGASEGNSSELDTTSSAVDFDADPRSVEKYSNSPKTPKISQKKTDEVYAKLKDGGFLDNDGNLVLYHLTLDDEDIIKSIKERGLVPRASEPSGQDWVGDHAPYATYFLGGGAQGKDTAIDQNEQLEGTIVEARIPVTKELLSRIIPDEEADDNAKKGIDTLLGGGAIAIIGGVPAKYLKYSNDKSRESKVETPPTTKAFPKLPKGARWVKDLEGTYYDLKGKLYRIENKINIEAPEVGHEKIYIK
jgi:hypothetical protein